MSLTRLLADAPLGTIQGTGKFQPNITGGSGTAPQQIENFISTIVGFLTVVGGLAFLIYFLIGAINWITAGGNEKKVETAQSYMVNGAIGMIIIIASYAIVSVVGSVLGIDIMNPASFLTNLGKGS